MDKNSIFLAILIIFVGLILAILIKKQDGSNNNIPQKEYNLNLEEETKPQTEPENKEEVKPQANDYQAALSKAKQENKEIILFFTADWCDNCTRMKNETLASSKVKESLDKYIYLEVNTDSSKELVQKYQIQGIPSYFKIDSNENKLNSGEGFISESKFLNWLYKK